jgi:hypothetical protein
LTCRTRFFPELSTTGSVPLLLEVADGVAGRATTACTAAANGDGVLVVDA